jgi:hypothetical protein
MKTLPIDGLPVSRARPQAISALASPSKTASRSRVAIGSGVASRVVSVAAEVNSGD